MAFHGMTSVCLHIVNVVETVDAGSSKTIGKEGDDSFQQGTGIEMFSAKEERHKDKAVLDPLLRANETHQGRQPLTVLFYIIYFFFFHKVLF